MVRLIIGKGVIIFVLIILSCDFKEQSSLPVYEDCNPIFVNGYTDKASYRPGEMIEAFLNFKSNLAPCQLTISKIDGTKVFTIDTQTIIQTQPSASASIDGFDYTSSIKIPVPTTLRSGIYLIENAIPFIVKSTTQVDLMVVYPSNTAAAYATSGGHSFYDKSDRADRISFHRPVAVQALSLHCLNWFLTMPDIKIGYVSDMDMDDFSNISNAKVLVIVGHSEYWTRKARLNFDKHIINGKHAIVLSGNTMWWQVRYSQSSDQLICYKDAVADTEQDVLLKTINWYESSLQYPILSSIGADFSYGGYGIYADSGWDGFKIVNPQSPLLKGLGFSMGDILDLRSGEYDGSPVSYFENGIPVLDKNKLGFYKVELIGFDKGSRLGNETIGTFIAFQKTETSGVVVNTASYSWCSDAGMGGTDGSQIKIITRNAIDLLLKGQSVFLK